MTDNKPNSLVSYVCGSLFTLGVLISILGVMAGHLYLWDRTGPIIVRSPYIAAMLSVPLMALSLYLLRSFKLEQLVNPLGGAICLVFLFLTDWLCRGYNFYQGPAIRGELLIAAVLSYLLIAKAGPRFFKYFLLGSIAYLIGAFLVRSDGQLIWSDDHPTFIYRLLLLKEQFPDVLFFNPEWNAGLYAGDLLATGALSVFFFASPLLAFFDVEQCYNFIVLFLIFGLTPAATYLAARLLKFPSHHASIAALLSISSHLLWYKWALKFGTLGFIVSTALIPLNIALCTLVLDDKREFQRWHVFLFVFSFSLMLFWTPAGLTLLPAIAIGVFRARKVLRKKFVTLLIALIMIVNLPWIYVLMKATNVGGFLQKGVFATEHGSAIARHSGPQEAKEVAVVKRLNEERGLIEPGKKGLNLRKSLTIFRDHSISTNPLILLLAIPGVLLFTGVTRWIYLLISLWLILMGTILAPFKPQLELSRMLVILSQVLVIPTALSLSWLIRRVVENRKFNFSQLFLRVGASVACGFLFVAPFSASSVLWNRSLYQYHFRPEYVDSLTEAIRQHGGDGRTMFSGFILHDLAHAHIGPLAKESGKPMLASSHVHNTWWRKDIIPESFREKGDQGIREFLDLYNVSAVVTHEKEWARYFREPSRGYKEVWKRGKFSLFARLGEAPGYFLEGSGQILSQQVGGVRLVVNSEDVVISFRHSPKLLVEGCELAPEEISEEVTFIRLSGCPQGEELILHGTPVQPWNVFL